MLRNFIAGFALMALGSSITQAADLVASPAPQAVVLPQPTWQVAATAYAWASGLDGKQALFGLPSVDVNLKFADVLPAINFAGMGIVEVRRGSFGVLGEGNFVKLSSKDTGPAGYLTLKLGVSAFFGLAAGTYRLAEGEWGNLDAIGGAKIFSFTNKVTLIAPSPLPTLHGEERTTWADATAGLKLRLSLSEKWFLTTWGMAGAGGSKYHWDALAAVGYQFNPTWSASAGYRAIGVNYKADGFTYDMVQHGPIIGVTARF